MADYFFESSALIKRYVREAGSGWVLSVCDPSTRNRVFIAAVTPIEILAAITRRGRGGTVSPQLATSACSTFKVDLVLEYEVLEFTSSVMNKAIDFAEGYGLRGYDAIQLATAERANAFALSIGLPPLTLASADLELNAAALKEGLIVRNPADTQPKLST